MNAFLAALVIGTGVLFSGSNVNVASAEPKRVDRNSEEHRQWQEEFRRRHGIQENKPAQRPPSSSAPSRSNSPAPAGAAPSTTPATPPARTQQERR